MTDEKDPPRFAKTIFADEHKTWTKHQIDEVWMSLRSSRSSGARQQMAYYEKKLKEMIADFDARHPGERERREKEKQLKAEKKAKRKSEAREGEKPKKPKTQKVASSSSATDSGDAKTTESLEDELDATLASFKKAKNPVYDRDAIHRYVVAELTRALKEAAASDTKTVVPESLAFIVPKNAVAIRCVDGGDRTLCDSVCREMARKRGLQYFYSDQKNQPFMAFFWVEE